MADFATNYMNALVQGGRDTQAAQHRNALLEMQQQGQAFNQGIAQQRLGMEQERHQMAKDALTRELAMIEEQRGKAAAIAEAENDKRLGLLFRQAEEAGDIQALNGIWAEMTAGDAGPQMPLTAETLPQISGFVRAGVDTLEGYLAGAPEPYKAQSPAGKVQEDIDAGVLPGDFPLQKEQPAMQIGTDANGNPVFYQGPAGGAPKLTEGQSKDNVYYSRASGAAPLLDQLDENLTSFWDDAAGRFGGDYGNFFQSEGYQRARVVGLEFLASILRKDTGAAVTKDEENMYGRIYLPQPGDKPETIALKQEARARALAAIESGMQPHQILMAEMAQQGVQLAPETLRDTSGGEGAQTGVAKPDDVEQHLWDLLSDEEKELWR